MNSIFSYDSKPMQILMFLGDLIILNLIFILCCLPVFTIGAAQAGLHTGIKVLLDKEDDTSPVAGFFRGFKTGFGTVTLSWGIMTLALALVIYLGVCAILLGAPAWLICIAIAFCAVFQVLVPLFHARFSCTVMQLIRNAWFMLFAHPLRSILVTALVWLPAFAFFDSLAGITQLLNLTSFLRLSPIWGALYYSTAFAFCNTIMKKPIKVLIDHYNETHPAAEPEVPAIEPVFRDVPETEDK